MTETTVQILTSIISSVLGGLVGGLFTFLGVKMTINHEEKKERRAKEELILQSRPRLDIVDFFEIDKYANSSKVDESLIIATIEEFDNDQFVYDDEILNEEKWISVEYALKNIGSTEIDHMYFSTNYMKTTSIFDNFSNLGRTFPKRNMLNYSVYSSKKIKPGDAFRLQINFLDGNFVELPSYALMTIWLADINGNWWKQQLFAPHNQIDNSIKTKHKEWYDTVNQAEATRCYFYPVER